MEREYIAVEKDYVADEGPSSQSLYCSVLSADYWLAGTGHIEYDNDLDQSTDTRKMEKTGRDQLDEVHTG